MYYIVVILQYAFLLDFVRAFTWDKLLEMWIKKYVGRGGRLPTVVSPDLYRKRFCEAMEKYFYQVPDKWTGMASKETQQASL